MGSDKFLDRKMAGCVVAAASLRLLRLTLNCGIKINGWNFETLKKFAMKNNIACSYILKLWKKIIFRSQILKQ